MKTKEIVMQDECMTSKPLLNKVNTKQKYYYMEEITSCVLCGRETKYRWRVYEKPEPHLRVTWKEDACYSHFI